MALYQLVGHKGLRKGDIVDMGPVGHRYGVIWSVVKEDYKLPNPCMVSGAIKFTPQPLNLYLLSGLEHTPDRIDGYVFSF